MAAKTRRYGLRAVPAFLRRFGYDAAKTTHDNRRHWQAADNLSPDAANSAEVRRTLRARARYEVANNSYAKGIVRTIADYTIGTGPRLQIQTEDDDLNSRIEQRFAQWAEEINLTARLQTMRTAAVQDGEAFAILTTNPKLESPVKLDLKLIEADQVAAPWGIFDPLGTDGIELDEYGNPVAYWIWKDHPGSQFSTQAAPQRYDARYVIHYFHADRPGQHRGIPELTPALPLFAQLRRYTLAVIAAAETAASFAAVLQTDAAAFVDANPVQEFDVVELEPRMATVLPAGYKLGQLETQHPSTTYPDFVRQIIAEICRCMSVPLAVGLGDSSQYNYASGRLDYQNWYRSMKVERANIERVVLTPILRAWLDEAILVSDFLPIRARALKIGTLARSWFWDGLEHVDPVKEAQAQKIRLDANLTTMAYEFARDGRDWETEIRQRAKEKAVMRELGFSDNAATAADSVPIADEE